MWTEFEIADMKHMMEHHKADLSPEHDYMDFGDIDYYWVKLEKQT